MLGDCLVGSLSPGESILLTPAEAEHELLVRTNAGSRGTAIVRIQDGYEVRYEVSPKMRIFDWIASLASQSWLNSHELEVLKVGTELLFPNE
jgi:hypothetical protein